MLRPAQLVFLTAVARVFIDLEPHDESALAQLDQMLQSSAGGDLEGLELHEEAVRELYDALVRAYDLLRNPKAPPRGTSH